MSVLVFFTIELIIRIVVSPNKKKFFKNFFNIVDLAAIIPKWVQIILRYNKPPSWDEEQFLYAEGYLSLGEVFRVLRVLKLGKKFTGLKVLILTIKASLTELGLLVFLILLCSVIFAVCIFFFELWEKDTFPDMAVGTYWAFITMTTVGYGDNVPTSSQGQFVAVLCAICGVLCTGLPIPIIANNFNLYYTYARIRRAIREKEIKRNRMANLRNLVKKEAVRRAGLTTAISQITNITTRASKKKVEPHHPSNINEDDSAVPNGLAVSPHISDNLSQSIPMTKKDNLFSLVAALKRKQETSAEPLHKTALNNDKQTSPKEISKGSITQRDIAVGVREEDGLEDCDVLQA